MTAEIKQEKCVGCGYGVRIGRYRGIAERPIEEATLFAQVNQIETGPGDPRIHFRNTADLLEKGCKSGKLCDKLKLSYPIFVLTSIA